MPRQFTALTNLAAVTSGTLLLNALELLAGVTVSNITFFSGTAAAATPTHQWFCLYDKNLNLLAVTSDDGATAWAANSFKTLAIALNASLQAASNFTTTYQGKYWVGQVVTATTVPSMMGVSVSTPLSLNPMLAGTSTTGLGANTTAPATAAALTAFNPRYAYVS